MPLNGDSYLIGYARVSTEDQNLDMQRDAMKAVGVKPDDIYDDKMSGVRSNRPGFEAALKCLRPGDTLVVWKVDRLGRDLGQVALTLETIARRGAGLFVITMPDIDTRNPTGKLMFTILAALAEWERALARERTIAGLQAARQRGRIGGRRREFNEKHKAQVRLLHSQGESAPSIRAKVRKAGNKTFALSTIQGYLRELRAPEVETSDNEPA